MPDDAATPERPEPSEPMPAAAPVRVDAGPAARPAGEDDSGGPGPQIEDLLVSGLDRYFAGRHEDAIHIWTRVLFIDRGHMRARAYIERARLALAERQREHEILLQDGVDALGRGDTGAAREMLARSLRDAGPDDRALAALARLDRLHHASRAPLAPQASAPVPRRTARRGMGGGAWISLLLILALSAGAAAVALGGLGPLGAIGPLDALGLTGARTAPAAAAPAPLPVITTGEAALVRARVLRDRGDLRGAAHALAAVPEADARRADADRLLIEIQDALLAQVR